jgi:tRNA pseudouridine55 synthase
MYSALKKDGKALYEYARKGEEVEREARHITIYKLNMAVAHDPRAQAAIKIIVSCSKGTYIRTLGEDIGEAIGCGAHLGSLRRLETGGFTDGQCISLPALEAMSEPEREACLLPVQSLVAAYPVVTLDADNAGRFLSGLRRRGTPGQWGPDAAFVQVYGPSTGLKTGNSGEVADAGAFLGSAHITADELIPGRLLSPIEIQDMQAQQAVVSFPAASAAMASRPEPSSSF